MLSVTADTNIYISGFLFGGPPRRFLDLAAAGDFRLDISEDILKETARVLQQKFLWTSEATYGVQDDIRSYAHLVTPTRAVAVIESDPSDNRILDCALTAQSDYLVTGDTRHILPLGSYGGVRIVTVAEFLRRLQEQQ